MQVNASVVAIGLHNSAQRSALAIERESKLWFKNSCGVALLRVTTAIDIVFQKKKVRFAVTFRGRGMFWVSGWFVPSQDALEWDVPPRVLVLVFVLFSAQQPLDGWAVQVLVATFCAQELLVPRLVRRVEAGPGQQLVVVVVLLLPLFSTPDAEGCARMKRTPTGTGHG